MDDISVDIEKSRREGYQNIISNRGARAARAHERKTNEKNENERNDGTDSNELETKSVLPLGPLPEGSRAKRRRENKEKKERELELYGVDGKYPVRLREGKRTERSVVIGNKEVLLENAAEVDEELNEFNENKEVIKGDKFI